MSEVHINAFIQEELDAKAALDAAKGNYEAAKQARKDKEAELKAAEKADAPSEPTKAEEAERKREEKAREAEQEAAAKAEEDQKKKVAAPVPTQSDVVRDMNPPVAVSDKKNQR